MRWASAVGWATIRVAVSIKATAQLVYAVLQKRLQTGRQLADLW
jgi:hypothetical protein